MGGYREVARRADLTPGKPLCVQVDGRAIALFDVGGAVHAIDDECPHAGGNLSEGEVEDGAVSCPWHGARFELASGKALTGPATSPVRAYPVKVEGGSILVEIDRAP